MTNSQRRTVTVVGAGFSGLAAAYDLMRAGFKVIVHDKSDRAGGLLGTHHTQWGPVETAANGVLNSVRIEDLAADIGLELWPTMKVSRRRYIWRDGAKRWPLTPLESLQVLRAFAHFLRNRRSFHPRSGESVRKWGDRVAGRAATRYLIEAVLQGIYAGDPERLSASLIFGPFFEGRSVFDADPESVYSNSQTSPQTPQQTKRTRRRPRQRGTVAPAGGMGEWIELWQIWLAQQGVEFHFNSEVQFDAEPSHPHILATPASTAGRLLSRVDAERSACLLETEMLPLVSVTLFFARDQAGPPGFGCLFPPVAERPTLGVLFNTFIFERRGPTHHSETWILGGAKGGGGRSSEEWISMDDGGLIHEILKEREAVFAGRAKPLGYHVTRWPAALPHYTVDYEKKLPTVLRNRHNLFLTGNYLGRIGLSKILENSSRLPDLIAREGYWK